MLVILRFRVEASSFEDFMQRARGAIAVVGARPGFVRGQLARALDDAGLVVLELEFDEVGSYRRALSSYDVKLNAMQLLSEAVDEPSAFEVLHERTPLAIADSPSLLASDHDTFNLGD